MEGEVRNWCLEYLVSNSAIETNIINKFISTISLSNTNHRTKKTVILRTLQDALSEASIPESMLQNLEVLETLQLCSDSSDSSYSNSIHVAMKAAYCSIAVECTLKYLEAGTSNPNYGKAVERIWKGRVHYMETEGTSFLLSDELKQWKRDIESSLFDDKLMEKLASMPNTRRDAIRKVGAFLTEAWDNLGSSFPESAANNVGVSQMNKQQEKGILKENEKVGGKFTATVGVEEVALSTSLPINEVPKNGESLKCSSVELQTLAKDPGFITEDTNQEPRMENRSTDANVSEPQMENMSIDENVGEPLMDNMRTDENVSEPHMENRSMDANEANLNGTASVHQSDARETASANQSDAHRPSLMKPNTTARTHKWDDSIDNLQGETSYQASKFSLPSPKRRKVSPLKRYEEPKNITKRRKPKRWSKLEEDTLRTGVKEFGRGRWKEILKAYTFEERTEVDLKDKWRNMMRYGGQ